MWEISKGQDESTLPIIIQNLLADKAIIIYLTDLVILLLHVLVF